MKNFRFASNFSNNFQAMLQAAFMIFIDSILESAFRCFEITLLQCDGFLGNCLFNSTRSTIQNIKCRDHWILDNTLNYHWTPISGGKTFKSFIWSKYERDNDEFLEEVFFVSFILSGLPSH